MPQLETFVNNLEGLGYKASVFETKEDACIYLNQEIHGKTVGFGGSVTLNELGLYPTLRTHNEVKWHWKGVQGEVTPQETTGQEVYLTSINGASENGELINIDGRGNRVSSSIFGSEKVYFVFGTQKIEKTYEKALWRARNIASPKNAQRLGVDTPCAKLGDRCYNCNSPQRICRSLVVHWGPSGGTSMEVVIIREHLGY